MFRYRRQLTVVIVTLMLIGGLLYQSGSARATTGPAVNLPPTYHVDAGFARLFIGEYTLQSIPLASRIKSAGFAIEYNDSGFLWGQAQFYGYDDQGAESSWVGLLYNFKQVAKNQIHADILAQSGYDVVLGHLQLTQPGRNKVAVGTMTIRGKSYPIKFSQINTCCARNG